MLALTLGVADQAQYIYDDLGRLSQVIDGQGNVATVNISINTVADVVGNVMVLPFTNSFQTQSAVGNIRPSVVRPSP